MVRLVFFLLAALQAPRLLCAEPLPVEQFFRSPDYRDLKISPDGTRVAFIVRGSKHDLLAVLDLATKAGRPVTNFADSDVLELHWINNHRLVFSVGDAREEYANAEYYGWFAVNADGTSLESIGIRWSPNHPGTRPARVKYIAPCTDGSDDILVELREDEDKVSVLRWNTMNGGRVDVGGANLTGVREWTMDRNGVPRVVRTYHEGREKIWYRESAEAQWTKLEDAEEQKLNIHPLAFDFDGTLYVAAYEGADKLAIYRYDTAKHKVGERLARHLDVDLYDMVFNRSKHRFLGVKYNAERPGAVWVDEEIARLQAMIDRALPGTVNELQIAQENPGRVLVTASSDISPPTYYIYDGAKRSLEKFSSSRPWIKPAEMSPRQFVRYKARDGLEIPAYLTIPKDSTGKDLPLVVVIHGGPWIGKQTWGFDVHAQFFASRGYAVLQPDFRGTTGYGKRHFESSFGQWGLSMQDDITDGVRWLVQQGTVDRSRVCLFGGSYGGYATLWGLMKTPDLYRCGVAFAALTDITYYFSFNRWDYSRAVWADYGARTLIGDPGRDADKFRSVSPVAQAERLKAPVLLAFGGVDQRVTIKNGDALKAALDQYGKKYEWVVYPNEGHGFFEEKNRVDFYRRVEAFLNQHLSR